MEKTTPNTVEIRVDSLTDTTVIQTIEMYLKNGYYIKDARWDSEEVRYVVIFTK